jgi:hypothetical protein
MSPRIADRICHAYMMPRAPKRYGANIVALAIELDLTLTDGERFALMRLCDAAKHRELSGSMRPLDNMTASCRFLATHRDDIGGPLSDAQASHGWYVKRELAAKGWLTIVKRGHQGPGGRNNAGTVNLRVPSHLIDAALHERSRLLNHGRRSMQMMMMTRIERVLEQGKARIRQAQSTQSTNVNHAAPTGHYSEHRALAIRSAPRSHGLATQTTRDFAHVESNACSDDAPGISADALTVLAANSLRRETELEAYWRRIHDRSVAGTDPFTLTLPAMLRHHGDFESCSKCWRAV